MTNSILLVTNSPELAKLRRLTAGLRPRPPFVPAIDREERGEPPPKPPERLQRPKAVAEAKQVPKLPKRRNLPIGTILDVTCAYEPCGKTTQRVYRGKREPRYCAPPAQCLYYEQRQREKERRKKVAE